MIKILFLFGISIYIRRSLNLILIGNNKKSDSYYESLLYRGWEYDRINRKFFRVFGHDIEGIMEV